MCRMQKGIQSEEPDRIVEVIETMLSATVACYSAVM